MAKKKTYDINNLTIGSKIFVVHKNHAFSKKPGGKVVLARVTSFINHAKTIKVEFKLVGHTQVLNDSFYTIFENVKEAINSIKS
jgi:hypothetical protein